MHVTVHRACGSMQAAGHPMKREVQAEAQISSPLHAFSQASHDLLHAFTQVPQRLSHCFKQGHSGPGSTQVSAGSKGQKPTGAGGVWACAEDDVVGATEAAGAGVAEAEVTGGLATGTDALPEGTAEDAAGGPLVAAGGGVSGPAAGAVVVPPRHPPEAIKATTAESNSNPMRIRMAGEERRSLGGEAMVWRSYPVERRLSLPFLSSERPGNKGHLDGAAMPHYGAPMPARTVHHGDAIAWLREARLDERQAVEV